MSTEPKSRISSNPPVSRAPSTPDPPTKKEIDPDTKHHAVWNKVQEALVELPSYFETETVIAGLQATDIFTLNSTLGATIEFQVVNTLNKMRSVWDPNDQYKLHSFIRQSQTFPDVLFGQRKPNTNEVDRGTILFGIELKGWYLLAKEKEPSFRYKVHPGFCADLDLIVIVPWFLTNILSGTPKVLSPLIESARYAAEIRNHWWQHIRGSKASTRIIPPGNANVRPYPTERDKISDQPESDSGKNFGRLARTSIMDEYRDAVMREPISGIDAEYWLDFFSLFDQKANAETIRAGIQALKNKVAKANNPGRETKPDLVEEILAILETHLAE